MAVVLAVQGSPRLLVEVPLWLLVAWLGGAFVFSRVGGWHRLAARYRAGTDRPAGVACPSCTVWMGGWFGPTYGRMMDITLSAAGLYIRPKWSYRLFHPPVLLPWRCVQSVREQKLLFFRRLEVRCVADAQTCKLYVPCSAVPIFNAEMAASKRRG